MCKWFSVYCMLTSLEDVVCKDVKESNISQRFRLGLEIQDYCFTLLTQLPRPPSAGSVDRQ